MTVLNELAYVPAVCRKCKRHYLADLHIEDWWKKGEKKKQALMRTAPDVGYIPKPCPACGGPLLQMPEKVSAKDPDPEEQPRSLKDEYMLKQMRRHGKTLTVQPEDPLPTFKSYTGAK